MGKANLKRIRELEKIPRKSNKVKARLIADWNKVFKEQEKCFTQPIIGFKSKFGNGHKKAEIRALHRTGFLRATGYKPTRKDTLKPKIYVWTGNRYH